MLPAAEVDAEGLAHRRDRPGQHHPALSGLGEIDVQLVIMSERLDLGDVLVRGAMGAGKLRARQRSDLLPVQTSGQLAAGAAAQDQRDRDLLIGIDWPDQSGSRQRHALAARNGMPNLGLLRHGTLLQIGGKSSRG
jgi:hypothetical protein